MIVAILHRLIPRLKPPTTRDHPLVSSRVAPIPYKTILIRLLRTPSPLELQLICRLILLRLQTPLLPPLPRVRLSRLQKRLIRPEVLERMLTLLVRLITRLKAPAIHLPHALEAGRVVMIPPVVRSDQASLIHVLALPPLLLLLLVIILHSSGRGC